MFCLCICLCMYLCTMQVSKTAVINPIVQFKAPTAQRIKKEKIKFKFSRLLSSHCESLPDLYSFWTWCFWHSLWWLAFKWLNIRNYLSQNTWIFLFLQVMKVIPTELGKTSVAFLPSSAAECNGLLRTSAKAEDVTQWQNPGFVGWTMSSVPRANEINTYQGEEYEPGSQSHNIKQPQDPFLKQREVRSGLVHWALSLLWPTYGSWLKSIVTISKFKHHTAISLKTWSHTWNVMPSFTQFANQGSLRPREKNKILTSKLPKRTGLGFRKMTRNKKPAF